MHRFWTDIQAREARNEEQKTQVDAGATKLKSENGPGSETTAPCPAEEKKETEPSLPVRCRCSSNGSRRQNQQ